MHVNDQKIQIRALRISDEHILARWLTDPTILKYYDGRDNPSSLERVRTRFYKKEDRVTRCIVEYEHEPIGYMQFYPINDEERVRYGYVNSINVYGMDQFIGESSYWNKGIGTTLVKMMVAYLTNEVQADKVVMDPQIQNKRALACYVKCGFQEVKHLPLHELHEGERRDCLLMEYVKENERK